MKQLLTRVGLGVLAVVALYITVMVGAAAAGLIVGFVSAYRKPHVTIQYIHCDDAHPSPECATAKSASVAARP